VSDTCSTHDRIAYDILTGKLQGKGPERRGEDNTEIEIGYEDVVWIRCSGELL